MRLCIGNKNYSSWSMRPWVLMRQFGIAFDELMLRFGGGFETGSEFKLAASRLSPTARVPVLIDGELTVWDSLSIAEYLAEKYPAQALWPRHPHARARARSVCAEMHSGFTALRTHCPMNIEASLPEVGARLMSEQPGVRVDLARIVAMWLQALADHRGPWLFGDYSIADAYYAPVASRIRTYGLPVPDEVQAYVDRLHASPGVAAWVREAQREHDFVAADEPYRRAPT